MKGGDLARVMYSIALEFLLSKDVKETIKKNE
jgi:hypothetical protein